MFTKRVFPLFLILSLILLSGCEQKMPDGMPKLYSPIILTVTQEKKPLAEVSVLLRSVDSSAGSWSIGGLTDANGSFELYTQGYRGAPLGKFKVILTKEITDDVAREVWAYIENEYASVETTPLEVEITASTKTLTVEAGPAVKIPRPYVP